MTAEQARNHLARLGLSQRGAAKLLRLNPRTFRRYLEDDSGAAIPRPVALALEFTPRSKVESIMEADSE